MSARRPDPAGASLVKQALLEIRRLRAELDAARRQQAEPIAIVGAGVRLPGGIDSLRALWEALRAGTDAIGPIPRDRWDHDALYRERRGEPGTYYVDRGGFLTGVADFDPEFFGIAPLEAITMDPQHRILLETTWRALEDAGIPPTSLHGTRTGVFVGIGNSDYARLVLAERDLLDAYATSGTCYSVGSGRIAYVLGLNGPAVTVDTACSASLVAAHLACQALRARECDAALAGGVNLILTPEVTIDFCAAGMLSPEGRCRTFDAGASGYVRSEGCCVVVLKRLADAERDGDRILAVIRGTAVNQDGRSSGLTAPSGPAQEAVIRAALRQAGVDPAQVGYVEAHGTGTVLGDPIEVEALGRVFRDGRDASRPLLVGSLKTNFGHLEAAAGVAGLLKAALVVHHGEVPPHLHFETPNPHIPWDELPIRIPTAPTPFPEGGRRLAGVSSFGFSGTNAHMVVEAPPRAGAGTGAGRGSPSAAAEPARAPRRARLLVVSASSAEALRAGVAEWIDFLRRTDERFADVCYTAGAGRSHFRHRVAVVAADAAEAAGLLETWLAAGEAPGLFHGVLGDDAASAPGARVAPAAARVAGGETQATGPAPGEAPEGAPAVPGRDGDDAARLLETARLYVAGGAPDWRALFEGDEPRRVTVPGHVFLRRRFWFGDATRGTAPPGAPPRRKAPGTTAVATPAWRAAVESAQRQAALAPEGVDFAAFPRKWRALNEFAVVLSRNLIAGRGAFPRPGHEIRLDDVLARTGIHPVYRRIVARCLEALAARGALARTARGYVVVREIEPLDAAPYRAAVERALADDPALLAYVRHAGELFPDVLVGAVSPLESLFPGGEMRLAEELYERSSLMRYANAVAAAALRGYLERSPDDRPVRVLEVGAGTGGTTSSLLPLLPAGRAMYDYTDVSEVFLEHGRAKFAAWPFLRTRLLDLDRDPAGQGFEPGSYDVVVAANAVHAAQRIRPALARLRTLLVPGGLLLLVESTAHHGWHDFTTGLIEGWQSFDDELRDATPLLDVDAWHGVLAAAGFSLSAAAPGNDAPAAVLEERVILALAPVATRPGPIAVAEPAGEATSGATGRVGDAGESGASAPAGAAGVDEASTGVPAHATVAGPSASAPAIEASPGAPPRTGDDAGHGAPFAVRDPSLLEALAAAAPAEREEAAVAVVRDHVVRVLHADPERPPARNARLMELGVDSLMAVRLRNALQALVPAPLPSTLVFDYPTIARIAELLLAHAESALAARTGAPGVAPAGMWETTPDAPAGTPGAAPAPPGRQPVPAGSAAEGAGRSPE